MSDAAASLETRLAHATDRETRIDLLCELAWELRDTDPEQSRTLNETAFQLASSDSSGREVYCPGLSASLRGLAHYHRRAGDLSLSLSQSMQALNSLKGAALPALEADILQNIAIALGSLGNYAEGLEYGFKALGLAQSICDQEREARILSSIAVIYNHSRNPEESLRVFAQALEINHRLGRKRYEGQTLNNMSLAYNALGDHEKALVSSLEALRLGEESRFFGLQVTATGTVGETYLALGDYVQARYYLQEYLAIARSAASKRDEAWALILLGETDLKQQLVAPALAYLSQALDLAQRVGLKAEAARSHELLAEAYENQGDLKEALAHLRSFIQVKENIFSEDTARRIANLQVMHQVETSKRDAEIQRLKNAELEKEIEERKKMASALKELAAVDPLTGVLNRREFFICAEAEFENAWREEWALTTLLFDLDYFKEINDQYGHSFGDQVLSTVAQIVNRCLRKGELVGRLGGDEFAILLPRTNLAQGLQIAERLQTAIGSATFNGGANSVSVTMSVGVAELDPRIDTRFDLLLDHADQAMYASKRAGRNCINAYSAT